MSKRWYYSSLGEQHGPVSDNELRALAARQELLPQDLVWRDGMDKWRPAEQIKGLFAPATPPAPGPGPSAAGTPGQTAVTQGAATQQASQPINLSQASERLEKDESTSVYELSLWSFLGAEPRLRALAALVLLLLLVTLVIGGMTSRGRFTIVSFNTDYVGLSHSGDWIFRSVNGRFEFQNVNLHTNFWPLFGVGVPMLVCAGIWIFTQQARPGARSDAIGYRLAGLTIALLAATVLIPVIMISGKPPDTITKIPYSARNTGDVWTVYARTTLPWVGTLVFVGLTLGSIGGLVAWGNRLSRSLRGGIADNSTP